MSVTVGQPVPDFSAVTTDGLTMRLSELRGHRVVLYFYPKDNTRAARSKASSSGILHDRFTALNAVVFGVSRDSLRSHDRFRAKHGFPFPLIADTDEALCQRFGVLSS
jgi:peroxiredoxin Q/BCP